MYHLEVIAYGMMTVHFINPLDTCILYCCSYDCDIELVLFTHATIFTNYNDFFPSSHFIHLFCFQESVSAKE